HGVNDDKEEYRTLHAARAYPRTKSRQPLWRDWNFSIGRGAAIQEQSEKSGPRPGRTAERCGARRAKGGVKSCRPCLYVRLNVVEPLPASRQGKRGSRLVAEGSCCGSMFRAPRRLIALPFSRIRRYRRMRCGSTSSIRIQRKTSWSSARLA